MGHEVRSRDSAWKLGNTDKCSYSTKGAPNQTKVLHIEVTGDGEYDGNTQIVIK